MSLLHSFYCWGQVGVVLLSTVFFQVAGIENWKILAVIWAVVPILNFSIFKSSHQQLVEDGQAMPVKKMLGMKIFWIFVLMMVCAGASEQAMSQWASAFAELGLNVNKTVGDLLGPVCCGADGLFPGIYGKFSDRINLVGFISGSAVLCVISYLLAVFSPVPVLSLAGCALTGLAVGIMWPGPSAWLLSGALREGPPCSPFLPWQAIWDVPQVLALWDDVGRFWRRAEEGSALCHCISCLSPFGYWGIEKNT